MKWKKLFVMYVLENGYDCYRNNTVRNLEVEDDIISADVIGIEDYEVEIFLDDGEIAEMHCSCPYATNIGKCRHMAAVLYKWSENNTEGNVEDERLLSRFYNTVKKQTTNEKVHNYIKKIDDIAEYYFGKNDFINYYDADDFISELKAIVDQDVCHIVNHGNYLDAFEMVNYIFILIGNSEIDDSNGGIDMLMNSIYQIWLELLSKVSTEDKRKMFDWFIANVRGSVRYSLEECIEDIIEEGFEEKEYEQAKLTLIENMLEKMEKGNSDWNGDYEVGKWVVRYLKILEGKESSRQQIEEVRKKYWNNLAVRKYCIDVYREQKEYNRVLQVLDESIILDKQDRDLVVRYNEDKKEIYLLQGNKNAYIEQLWKLVLEYKAGDLELYRELKEQYSAEEWLIKREELFKKLPEHAHVERLYKEEKLYDRLLTYVLNSSELYALQEYEDVLEEEYPEQILGKYKDEVNKMAVHTSNRKQYVYMVSLLQRMQQIKGGTKIVEEIVGDWKEKYKNRPAMMDELSKL